MASRCRSIYGSDRLWNIVRSSRPALYNSLAPIGDQLRGGAHWGVLGMHVTHEHHDRLVCGQRHADLDRNTGVGNVGG